MPFFDDRIVLPEPVAQDVYRLLGMVQPLRTGLEETLEGIIPGEMSTSERARRSPLWLLDLVSRNFRGLVRLSRMVGYTRPCFRQQQRALQDLFGLLSFFSHSSGPTADQFERFAHSSGVYFLQEIFREIAHGLLANYDHNSLPIIIHNIAVIDIGPSGTVAAPGSHLATAGPSMVDDHDEEYWDAIYRSYMPYADGSGPVCIWGNTHYYADGTITSY